MNKEDLTKKWLAGELSAAEMEAFKKLDDYPMHTKILDNARYFKAPEPLGVEALYEKIDETNTDTVKVRKIEWYKPLLKIAAILVLFSGLSFFFLTNNDTTVHTLVSQKENIELPDSSEVVVNAKSEIVFNKKEWDDKREVNLVGEAFFKVKKGSNFDVLTNYGKVSVLGTQFNVKNRDNFYEVSCYEGLVKVQYNNFTRVLSAGDILRIIDGNITFETTNKIHPQWINNISSFKSVPFYQVIQEFKRHYNVTFTLKNIDENRVFTGGFVHDNMEDGLNSITLPLDLIYSIDASNHILLQKDE